MFRRKLLAGVAAALLLSNETVQKTAIKSVVRVWLAVQGGCAEVKERFRDDAEEIRAAQGQKQELPSNNHSEAS